VLLGLKAYRYLRHGRAAVGVVRSVVTPVPGIVTVQSPAPSQAVYRETQFQPVQVDTFAEAYAYAEREVGTRYPASKDLMETLRSLINQYLAGKGIKPRNTPSQS
jgi:hypothetical protein